MKDSILILIIIIFIGILFSFLANKYKKSKIKYFFFGVFSFLIVHLIYMAVFGLITDFKLSYELNVHRKYSMILSFCFSYISYKIIKFRLFKEKESKPSEIHELGKF